MTQTTTVGGRPLRVGQTVRVAALGLVVLLIAAVLIANQAGSAAPGVETAPVGRITPSAAHIREAVPALAPAREGPAVPVVSSDGTLWDCCWTSQGPQYLGPENGIGGP